MKGRLPDGFITETTIGNPFEVPSARAPRPFVEEVLPFILEAIGLNLNTEGEPPWQDNVWMLVGTEYGIDSQLIGAMRTALRSVAREDPAYFRETADLLRSMGSETAHYLLVGGWAGNPEEFSDEVAEYLLQRNAHFRTHRMDDSHWDVRELLVATTPHCSEELLKRLEVAIMDYYPERELLPELRETRGYAQFELLGGVERGRLSAEAKRRIDELGRKFERAEPRAPRGIEVGMVGSPIEEPAAQHMSDEQWLSAIAKYDKEEIRNHPRGPLVGGAYELAQTLGRVASSDPERFAKLLLKFPDETNVAYFDAILRAVAGAALRTELLVDVCERCHGLPGRPCGMALADLIGRSAKTEVPVQAMEILAWYATEHPDPVPGFRAITIEGTGGPDDSDRELLTNGLNSTRGAAARAIGILMFADTRRNDVFHPVLKQMVSDPSPAVRSMVAIPLQGLLSTDRDESIELFMALANGPDELLGTSYVYEFLRFGTNTHLTALLPVLQRMVASSDEHVARMGAQLACMAALDQPEAEELARQCTAGLESQRTGAAAVFATNLHLARFRALCEEFLSGFFSDESEPVRAQAARCFNRFEGSELAEIEDLIRRFCQSPAFEKNGDSLIRALERSTAELADVTCLACESFFAVAGSRAGDIRTHEAGEAHTMTALVVRAYSQASTPELKSRCLDLVDRMIQVRAMGFDKALSALDR